MIDTDFFDWAADIKSAKDGNGDMGRWLLKMASRYLEEDQQWPEELRVYMAEILKAAAIAPASLNAPNNIVDVLNVTLPPGAIPHMKKVEDIDAVSACCPDALKYAKYHGVSRDAALVKVVAEKFCVSEKTARRKIKFSGEIYWP